MQGINNIKNSNVIAGIDIGSENIYCAIGSLEPENSRIKLQFTVNYGCSKNYLRRDEIQKRKVQSLKVLQYQEMSFSCASIIRIRFQGTFSGDFSKNHHP